MDDTPIPTLAEKIRAIPNGYRLTPAAFFAFDVALRAAAALVEVEAAKTPIGSADSVESSSPPAAALGQFSKAGTARLAARLGSHE